MVKESDRKDIIKWIIIGVVIIVAIYLIVTYLNKEPVLPGPASAVTRSFDKATADIGEEITVSLTVDVDESIPDRVYSIEEILPADATVTDAVDGTVTSNKWRFLEHTSVVDTVKTYKVTFSTPGTKTFSGTFVFNSESLQTVAGSTSVSIACWEEDENCDGCVSAGEIASYINCWLTDCVWGGGDNVVTQIEVTYADDRWLQGITSC